MDDDTRMVPIEDLQFTKRTDALPQDLFNRITLIHHAFRDYLTATLEETLNNFTYDEQPENEVRIWERMASVVLALRYHYEWPQDKVAVAAKVVLGLSMGAEPDNELDDASKQLIVALWNARGPQ